MQGWRISMEDAHTTILDLLPVNKRTDDLKSQPEELSFFGVYDGHGGDKVALFSGENIPSILLKQDTFKSKDYAQALKDTFLATDRAILNGTPLANSPLQHPAGLIRHSESVWLAHAVRC
jgi:protein phosphatase 2C family protein 2/3